MSPVPQAQSKLHPRWDWGNLEDHLTTRTRENKGCIEDLLGISGRDMTIYEYQGKSQSVVNNPAFAWETDECNERTHHHYTRKTYFVDQDLVLVVLNEQRTKYITCFHLHFAEPHGVDPSNADTLGERRLKLTRWVKKYVSTKRFKKLKWINEPF
jgi:hypothetical protein